jgi:hypothetical protein
MYAIAVPLIAGKVEAWKTWIHECQGPLREEFESFNERMELTLHRAWLVKSPQQPQVIVVYDGAGAKKFLRKLAASQEPFDKWFRARITEYHGLDFSKLDALPPTEIFLDYSAPVYAGIEEK